MKKYLLPLVFTFTTLYVIVVMIRGTIEMCRDRVGEYAENMGVALTFHVFMILAVCFAFGGICLLLWREIWEKRKD